MIRNKQRFSLIFVLFWLGIALSVGNQLVANPSFEKTRLLSTQRTFVSYSMVTNRCHKHVYPIVEFCGLYAMCGLSITMMLPAMNIIGKAYCATSAISLMVNAYFQGEDAWKIAKHSVKKTGKKIKKNTIKLIKTVKEFNDFDYWDE